MDVLALWSRYLVIITPGREFVNCDILDEICGKNIQNKCRKYRLLVSEIISGSDVVLDDVCREIVLPREPTKKNIRLELQQELCSYLSCVVSKNCHGMKHVEQLSRFFKELLPGAKNPTFCPTATRDGNP